MIPCCSPGPVWGLSERDVLLLELLWDAISLCDVFLKGKVLAIMENLNLDDSQGSDSTVRLLSSPLRWHKQVWLCVNKFTPGLTLIAALPSSPCTGTWWCYDFIDTRVCFQVLWHWFWELLSSMKGWALVSENTGLALTLPILYYPGKRDPNVNIDIRQVPA